MGSRLRGGRHTLAGWVIVAALAGCAGHPAPDSAAGGEAMASGARQDADTIFDRAGAHAREGLEPLDLERLGLGQYWNMLDDNGDGRISRREFRRHFDDPGLQRQLQARTQALAGETAEPAAAASLRLPPPAPLRGWQRSETVPSAAPVIEPSGSRPPP